MRTFLICGAVMLGLATQGQAECEFDTRNPIPDPIPTRRLERRELSLQSGCGIVAAGSVQMGVTDHSSTAKACLAKCNDAPNCAGAHTVLRTNGKVTCRRYLSVSGYVHEQPDHHMCTAN